MTLIIPYIEQKYQSFHCFIPYVLWNLFFKILHSGIFHWFKPQTGQHGKTWTERKKIFGLVTDELTFAEACERFLL